MPVYQSDVSIAASPEAVWNVLVDAPGYKECNPEIVAIEGSLTAGARIKARVRVASGAIRPVPMRVTAFQPPSTMQWTGGLPLGLFTGRRTFTVRAAAGGAHVTMLVEMTGPLASLMLKATGDRQAEIDRFTSALRARVEAGGTKR